MTARPGLSAHTLLNRKFVEPKPKYNKGKGVRLLAACAHGNTKLVKEYLSADDVDVNQVFAAQNVLELSLLRNAQKDDSSGEGALHVACRLKFPTVMLLLLKRKADPSHKGRYGWTPLHVSSQVKGISHCDSTLILLSLQRMGTQLRLGNFCVLEQMLTKPIGMG